MKDIERISNYFLENKQYRNNLLFIMGINFGLRCSDLRILKFKDIINSDSSFKTTFPILELKTSKTRKAKKNRRLTINDYVREAILIYLQNHQNTTREDFIFRSESNNAKNLNQPISRKGIEYIIKNVTKTLNIEGRYNTHSLRKTFGYFQMVLSNFDERKLELLQIIFGHATRRQTLSYIGLTNAEVANAYLTLNLGSQKNFIGSEIIDEDIV